MQSKIEKVCFCCIPEHFMFSGGKRNLHSIGKSNTLPVELSKEKLEVTHKGHKSNKDIFENFFCLLS